MNYIYIGILYIYICILYIYAYIYIYVYTFGWWENGVGNSHPMGSQNLDLLKYPAG